MNEVRPPMDPHRLATVKQAIDRAEDFDDLKDALQLLIANLPNYGEALEVIQEDRDYKRRCKLVGEIRDALLKVQAQNKASAPQMIRALETVLEGERMNTDG